MRAIVYFRRMAFAALLVASGGAARCVAAQVPRWSPRLGAGLDLLGPRSAGGAYRPGYALQAGLDWRAPRGQLLVGLTASGVERRSSDAAGPIRTRLLGFALEGRYYLAPSGVRPYLLIGLGGTVIADRRALPAEEGGGTRSHSESGTHVTSGLGVQWPTGRLQLYAEAALVRMDNPNVTRAQVLPLTLGARF
jgi:opacity protein-like surface antigen